jgi:hypothetical protein
MSLTIRPTARASSRPSAMLVAHGARVSASSALVASSVR